MFIGSVKGNQYEGILPASGDYKIRVYLMRSAARRKEVAHYRLEMIVQNAPKGQAPVGDAKVAGTNYHATGKVPCSTAVGQPTGLRQASRWLSQPRTSSCPASREGSSCGGVMAFLSFRRCRDRGSYAVQTVSEVGR